MSAVLIAELVAPCGINCGLCRAYLAYSRGVPREKGKVTHCSGCRVRNRNCAFLKRDCEKLRKGKVGFCFECADMPCENLRRLDDKYRKRYGMSPVENLQEIKDVDLDEFLLRQRNRYGCPNCGDVVSVHDGICYRCLAEQKKGR